MSDNSGSSCLEVLLVSADAHLAGHLKNAFLGLREARGNVTVMPDFDRALEEIYRRSYDIAVIDLASAAGMNSMLVARMAMEARYLPLLVLVPRGFETVGKDCIVAGAQDWVPVEGLTDDLLSKAVGYAMERRVMQEMLRTMSLVDEGTGLYNKTGFLAVAVPQMQMTVRQRRKALLFSIDLLDAESIEAKLGKHERHNAAILAAQVAWNSFRRSDMIGRIAPESFAVLAHDAGVLNTDVIIRRIRSHAKERRKSEAWPFEVRFNIGYVEINQDTKNLDLDFLLEHARSMAPVKITY